MGPKTLELVTVAVGQNDQRKVVVRATGSPEAAKMVAEALAQGAPSPDSLTHQKQLPCYILLSSSCLFSEESPLSAVTYILQHKQ